MATEYSTRKSNVQDALAGVAEFGDEIIFLFGQRAQISRVNYSLLSGCFWSCALRQVDIP